jgi:hypothetical protein
MKFLGKNKKMDQMSDTEQKAKTSVLEDLRQQAAQAMGQKMQGLKKVTVAAPDSQGLKQGLKKAEDLTKQLPEEQGEEVDPEDANDPEDMADGGADEATELDSELEDLSPEEIDATIQKLQALKAQKLQNPEQE